MSEFEQRAAAAWIRAADAGLIDASELGWLLDTVHKGQRYTNLPTGTDDHVPIGGRPSGGHAAQETFPGREA